jgi:His/Glu/Gln/Arg/opine family amino acid ABC transporter permease subunit
MAFIGGGASASILALGRVSQLKWLRLLSAAYIQIIQGTPLLVVLFLAYFGLSILGLDIEPIIAAGLSLTVYTAAFLGEIWRGCILSVPKTQWEASNCIGLSPGAAVSLRHPAAGCAYSDPADGRFHGADRQEYVDHLDHRLRRARQSWPDRQQLDVPAVHHLCLRGHHLFRDVLPPLSRQQTFRKEAQCR